MNKNSVICGIEHALRDHGCNEFPVTALYDRVHNTRGNFNLSPEYFMEILRELDNDDLFEFFGDESEFSQDLLIARSQMHPSVP